MNLKQILLFGYTSSMHTRKEEVKTLSVELNINKLKKRGIFMVPINMKLSVLEGLNWVCKVHIF